MHILDMNLSVTKVSVRVRWCACALKSPVPHWHAILGDMTYAQWTLDRRCTVLYG